MHFSSFIKKQLPLLMLIVAFLALAFALRIYHDRPQYGHLRLSVQDAYTLAPVVNAYVVLPEYNIFAYTDNVGKAILSKIPVRPGKSPRNIPDKAYGETMIIAYGQGYTPCVLFFAHVYPDKVRSGPTIYLFPEQEKDAIAMIESPDKEWVQTLIQRFAPEGFTYTP